MTGGFPVAPASSEHLLCEVLSFQRQQDYATVFVLDGVDEIVVRELSEELIYRLVLPAAFDSYVLTRG